MNAVQADIIDQYNANNSATSTAKKQQQKKDTGKCTMEKISVNIFT